MSNSYASTVPVLAEEGRVLALIKAGSIPFKLAKVSAFGSSGLPLRLAIHRGEPPFPVGGQPAAHPPSKLDPTGDAAQHELLIAADGAEIDLSDAGPQSLCPSCGYRFVVDVNGDGVVPGKEAGALIGVSAGEWLAIKALSPAGLISLRVEVVE